MYRQHLSELEDRFLRYVQIDTQSEEHSTTTPSTAKQLTLSRMLRDELEAMGAQDVRLTDPGYVLATIPATVLQEEGAKVAFLAHVDTAPAFSGKDIKPIVHRSYDGSPIVLPDDPQLVLSPESDPDLTDKIGEDIVTASGLTLLGADDKAGVAIIMTLASYLLSDPDIPHGEIRICFTPDEEVGRGVENVTLQELDVQVAYTLDGGPLGEVTYETFSANRAVVTITGVSTHTGTAKGKMVNALHLAAKLINMLPQDHRTPETTEGREGFIHLYEVTGHVAEAQLRFLLRDFELEGLKAHGNLVMSLCQTLQEIEPRSKVECTIDQQYRNMRYWIEEDKRPVELAVEATEQAEVMPVITPVRGGTDGARLTQMGLPTPNLFTGAHNFHGPTEWISLQDMAKSTEMCINLVKLWARE